MNHDDGKALLVLHDDQSPLGDVTSWLRECVEDRPPLDVLRISIVVGELYDNARLHGVPPFTIELVQHGRSDLTISVSNRTVPTATAWRQRSGLLLVESLTEQWGVVRRGSSTTAWADVFLLAG